MLGRFGDEGVQRMCLGDGIDMGLGQLGRGDVFRCERLARLRNRESGGVRGAGHHSTTLGTTKKWSFGLRRVLHQVVGIAAIGHHILAHLEPLLDHARHGRHALDIDLGKLLHPGEQRVQLGLHGGDLVLVHGQPRKPGDAPDGLSIDGHGGP